MNYKKLFVYLFVFVLMLSFASSVTVPDNAQLFYNFSSVTDLWLSNDATNAGANSNTSFPTFNISGSSTPDSYNFQIAETDWVDTNFQPDFTTSGFTINFWFRTTQTAEAYFMGYTSEQGVNDPFMYFQMNEGADVNKFKMRIRGDGSSTINSLTSTTSINDDAWHMATITYVGVDGKFRLYIDAVNEANVTETFNGNIDTNVDWYIGAINNKGAPAGYYDGLIDHVMIMNSTTNLSTIQTMYNYGDPTFTPVTPTGDHYFLTTVEANQISNVSIQLSTYTNILSGSFVVTNTTNATVNSNINVLGTANNAVAECRLELNGTAYNSSTVTVPNNEFRSLYNFIPLTELTAGNYTYNVQCRKNSTGKYLAFDSKSIVTLYINNEGENLEVAQFSGNFNLNSSSFTSLGMYNFTLSNVSAGSLEKSFYINGNIDYTFDSTGTITVYAVVNGTKTGEYPRYGVAGTTGSGMGVFLLPNVSNVANDNISIEFFAKSSTSDGSINIGSIAAEIISNPSETNHTYLNNTNIVSNTWTTIKTLNFTNADHAQGTVLSKAGVSVISNSGSADIKFRYQLNSNNGTAVYRSVSSANQEGIAIVQDTLNSLGVGNYTISLQALSSNSNASIVGGDWVIMLVNAVSFTQTSFNVTLYDTWDNSTINNFNVTVDGGSTFQSSGGVAIITPNSATESLFIESSNYFNKTVNNHNTANNLNTSMNATEYRFLATEIITNNSVSPANFTITDGTVSKIITDSDFISLKPGNYNVTFSRTGWFSKTQSFTVSAFDNLTVTITDVSSTALNITALQWTDNATITTFSGSLYNAENDITINFSTATGFVEVGVALNQTFIVNISSSGYASTSETVTINESPVQNYTSFMFPFNSINVVVRDAGNFSIIDWQNVSISTIQSNSSVTNITSTGTILLQLLVPQDYELRFQSDGYVTSSRFLTVLNDSTTTLTVYMETNNTATQQIRVIDTGSNRVAGAIVRVQKEVLNSTQLWFTVQEVQTDSEGQAYITIEKDASVFYRFSVSLDGVPLNIGTSGGISGLGGSGGTNLFTTKTSFITGVSEIVQIVVVLDETQEGLIDILDRINFDVNYFSNDTVVVFDWTDSGNVIVGARLFISGRFINSTTGFESISNVQINSSSGSLNYTFPIINNTEYRVQAFIVLNGGDSLVHERLLNFGQDVLINRGTGMLLAVIIIAFIAFMSYTFGPLISSVLTFSALFPLYKFGLIDIPITIITSLIALAIILFIRPRGVK